MSHRERLNEETSLLDDAIVCSYENRNRKKLAEMTSSCIYNVLDVQ